MKKKNRDNFHRNNAYKDCIEILRSFFMVAECEDCRLNFFKVENMIRDRIKRG